jgi:hypothetical protein
MKEDQAVHKDEDRGMAVMTHSYISEEFEETSCFCADRGKGTTNWS